MFKCDSLVPGSVSENNNLQRQRTDCILKLMVERDAKFSTNGGIDLNNQYAVIINFM